MKTDLYRLYERERATTIRIAIIGRVITINNELEEEENILYQIL